MTITVAAHKGGVGKTTTALALASAFSLEGWRTLLVDLDPQGHATMGLDVPEGGPTVRDLLADSACPLEEVTVALRANLSIVPSDIRLERAVQWLYGRPRRDQILASALAKGPRYEAVILDCPPSLGPLTEGALVAADLVLVPCRLEARAVDGLVDLLELLSLLRGEAFDGWRLLLTQIDVRCRVTNEAMRAALRRWASRICSQEIPRSEALNQAQIARQDIFTFAPMSAGAVAYRGLCEEVRRGKYGSTTVAARLRAGRSAATEGRAVE